MRCLAALHLFPNVEETHCLVSQDSRGGLMCVCVCVCAGRSSSLDVLDSTRPQTRCMCLCVCVWDTLSEQMPCNHMTTFCTCQNNSVVWLWSKRDTKLELHEKMWCCVADCIPLMLHCTWFGHVYKKKKGCVDVCLFMCTSGWTTVCLWLCVCVCYTVTMMSIYTLRGPFKQNTSFHLKMQDAVLRNVYYVKIFQIKSLLLSHSQQRVCKIQCKIQNTPKNKTIYN